MILPFITVLTILMMVGMASATITPTLFNITSATTLSGTANYVINVTTLGAGNVSICGIALSSSSTANTTAPKSTKTTQAHKTKQYSQ